MRECKINRASCSIFKRICGTTWLRRAIPVCSSHPRNSCCGRLWIYCFTLPIVLLVFGWQAAAQEKTSAEQWEGIVSDIEIRIVGHTVDAAEWTAIADSIISFYVKAGDSFSEKDVKESLSALRRCGRFKTIDADSRGDIKEIILVYTLTPFKLIKEIKIEGKYPLFKNKILNAMTVYPGDVFAQGVVDAQPELVADLFRREGFIDPQVVIGSWQDPEDGHYIMFVNIDKGPYYTLGQIVFHGNLAFDDSVLKWRMKSWRKATFGRAAGRFRAAMFKDDIDNVKDFYRKMHFADVNLRYELSRYPDSGRVDAEITVSEGPRYEITFEGHKEFWSRTLKKEIVLDQTGNRGGMGLRRSLKNIKSLYYKAGYPDTRIRVEREDRDDDGIPQRDLRVVIEEGTRRIVDRVNVFGNKAYTERKVKKQVLTRPPGFIHAGGYVPETLDEDLLMIKNLYHKKGYMDPRIDVDKVVIPDDEHRDLVAIDLYVEEGVQTRVESIVFEGLDPVFNKKVTKSIGLRKGRPFRDYVMKNDARNIAALLSEKGYPYAKVTGHSDLSEDGRLARIVFNIEQGQKIVMGNTHYSGNFRTRKRILDRELEMEPGDAFSLQSMHTGQKNIRGMNIFRSVQFKPVGLQDQKERIELFADVDEKDPYFFQVNGGYESEKGLYAGSRLGDHNFFGLNKDVWIGGEVSQTGYWAESGIFEPRFLGTRISSDYSLYLERDEPFNQTFGTMAYGVNLFFSRRLTDRVTGNLGLSYERREQFSRESALVRSADFDKPRGIVVASPSIAYDSRDSFIRPRNGIFSFASVDLSKGIENSYDDFYKYRLEVRGFTTPSPRVTFAGRGSFGDIDPYGSEGVVPEDQLFYLGGTATIRGFDENLFLYDSMEDPVGGELAAVASAEVRLDMGRNIELSLFYDVGYLDATSGAEVTDNVRDAVGLGLRYLTPIGAMGILYGHKIDPEPEESAGRIHFSIGHTF